MKFIRQFFIIILISFIGEACHYFIPIPVPASIYGLVIMLVCLKTRIIKLHYVKETADYLIEIMPLMFIPPAVGLIDSYGVLKPLIVPVILITLVSTVIVMVVSGRVTQAVIRHTGKHKGGKDND